MNRAVNNMIGVGVFAIAMAYVESAVVVYLRALYGIEDLLLDMPELPDQYTLIELGREASTLVMLIMIGWVAGRGRPRRGDRAIAIRFQVSVCSNGAQ